MGCSFVRWLWGALNTQSLGPLSPAAIRGCLRIEEPEGVVSRVRRLWQERAGMSGGGLGFPILFSRKTWLARASPSGFG